MIKYAVNQEFCRSDRALQTGDEVALIPPVAGGSAHVRVTDGPLDLRLNPYTGSTAGTVRVVALQDVDVAVRNVESFATMVDALTV